MMPEDISGLIEALRREPDPTQQTRLITQLGALRASEAVDLLAQRAIANGLDSGAAIVALGQIGDPRAVEPLIACFRYEALAWIAKDALRDIGPEFVEPLITALNHPNPDVRFNVIRTLAELGDLRAVDALDAARRDDPDDNNRELARATLKGLLLGGLISIDPAARRTAVDGLERLGDARAADALQSLAENDPDPDVLDAAERAILALVAGVATAPDRPVRGRETGLSLNRLRHVLGSALIEIGPANDRESALATASVLTQVMTEHDDDEARELACRALWQLGLDLLRHPSALVRHDGIQVFTTFFSIGTYRDDAARLLDQLAAADPDPDVRRAAQAAGQ